jgi:outer membrane protein assembly factor BamB/predicted phosphohydrolase
MDDVAFTIVSGDIAETGKRTDLQHAKSILDSLKKPYHIIPGNHDTKWSESGCTEFSQLWGDDKFVFEYAGYRFIGLNSGPPMRMGDGHFAPEDLRWVDSVLHHLPNKMQPLVLITHYPLDPSLDNWYELLDCAKRYNTKIILVGHGHGNRGYSFEGIPAVMGRSTLRASHSVGGYTIGDIACDSIFFCERTTGVETKPVWHAVGLERKDYLADTTKFERPDFSINRKYPNVKVKWQVETGFTIASTAAVWEDYVIVGNSSGMVYCLGLSDGTKKWTFRTGNTVYSTPDVSDGKTVFGSSDGNIYCLDILDGKLLWQLSTDAPVVSAPRISEGVVFVGGSDGKFRAINVNTGDIVWEFNGLGGFVETRPLVYEQKVIFGAWDTYLYALNTMDGSLVWKWSNDKPGILYSPAACWPVASDGKVFIVAPDRFMTSIDAETGKNVWRTNLYQVREAIGISEGQSRIYARCMTDTLLAFTSSSSSPQLDWSTPCGYGYDIDPSMPIEKNGVVFFSTKNGLVIAVDARTGSVKWLYRTGVALVNTVTPLDSNQVVVTTMDGKVMMIEGD